MGGFAPAHTFGSGGGDDSGPFSIATDDFNGDGNLDLVVANLDANTLGVLLGNGMGSFAAVVKYPSSGNYPISVITGDFNGDGMPDVAATNLTSNNVAVLLNLCKSAKLQPIVTIPLPSNSVAVRKTPSISGEQKQPMNAFLLSASPNPFIKSTRIQYSVPVDAQVYLKIFDVLGREVNTLFNGQRSAGNYVQEYNTSKLSQGVYYCRMIAVTGGKAFTQSQKLVKAE
jgi:hypothetical protein